MLRFCYQKTELPLPFVCCRSLQLKWVILLLLFELDQKKEKGPLSSAIKLKYSRRAYALFCFARNKLRYGIIGKKFDVNEQRQGENRNLHQFGMDMIWHVSWEKSERSNHFMSLIPMLIENEARRISISHSLTLTHTAQCRNMCACVEFPTATNCHELLLCREVCVCEGNRLTSPMLWCRFHQQRLDECEQTRRDELDTV